MKRQAFTLIELLVVISIITLLIAILLPALAAARSTAHGVKCLANQRQLGLGIAIYANDYDEYHIPLSLPTTIAWPGLLMWKTMDADRDIYTNIGHGDVDMPFPVLYCPTNVNNGLVGNNSNPYNYASNYSVNSDLFGNTTPGSAPLPRLSSLTKPSECADMWDAIENATQPGRWAPLGGFITNIQNYNAASRIGFVHGASKGDAYRTGSTAVLFQDGHAAMTKPDPDDFNRLPIAWRLDLTATPDVYVLWE